MNLKVLLFLALVATVFAAAPFDTTTAYRFLYYSYAAYCSESSLMKWDCKFCKDKGTAGFNITDYFDNKLSDTIGYVGYNHKNKEVVVAFRGSRDLMNWITDLEFWKVDTPFDGVPGAFVSSGYYHSYERVRAGILKAVVQLRQQYPTYQMYVTGHSLGAALSTLLVTDLGVKQVAPNTIAYTFGCPRVGDLNFSQAAVHYSQSIWRMVNHHDIVPHLPLRSMGFHHAATEVWENDKVYKVCDDSGEDPHCSDSILAPLSAYDHTHYMGVDEDC
jgi:hypothetical protein